MMSGKSVWHYSEARKKERETNPKAKINAKSQVDGKSFVGSKKLSLL